MVVRLDDGDQKRIEEVTSRVQDPLEYKRIGGVCDLSRIIIDVYLYCIPKPQNNIIKRRGIQRERESDREASACVTMSR